MAKLNRSNAASPNFGPGNIAIPQGSFRDQQDVIGDSLLQLGGRGEVVPGSGTVNDPLNAPFVLYVNPYIGKDDFAFGSYATESSDPLRRIELQRLTCGYTEAAPFATLNRAIIEAGIITSKDYFSGTSQDFLRVCIVLAPGTYDLLCSEGVATSAISAFTSSTTVDDAYLRGFNPETKGGIILPRGCSVVSLDLRKTILRPEAAGVPDSDQDENLANRRAILRVTGEGYYYGFTFMDADPAAPGDANKRSHHMLSCFEFASKAQVDEFYAKIAKAFATIDSNLTSATANATEYIIVAEQKSSPAVTVDSTASASPYIYNISIRSQYGLCGILADGAGRTGFRSMVVAQFTGVSLQNDYRNWQQYSSGSWGSVSDFAAYSGADPDNIRMHPQRRSFHVRAINRAVIQEVSVFAIGQGVHHWTQSGGELTITNSNSNFGGCAGLSQGYQETAATQDMDFVATHQRVPSDLSEETNNIRKIYIGTVKSTLSDNTVTTLPLEADVSGLGEYSLVTGSYVWIESPTTADYRAVLGTQGSNKDEIIVNAAFTTDTNDGTKAPGAAIGTTGLNYPDLANRRVYIRRLIDTRSPSERRYSLLFNSQAGSRTPQRDYILRDQSSGVGTAVDVAVLKAGTTKLVSDSTTPKTEVELKQINPATGIRAQYMVYRPGDALSINEKHYICNHQVVSTGASSASFLANNFEENYVHMQNNYNPEDFFKNTQPVLIFDHDEDQAEASATLGWEFDASDSASVWTNTVKTKNKIVQGQFKSATDYRGLEYWCSTKAGITLATPKKKAQRDVAFGSNVNDQEFRRPSVIRMYGHAYEWSGFGNYSKALPQYQKGMEASNKFTYYGTSELGGRVYFTGFNEEGFAVSPRGVEDIQTGEVQAAEEINAPDIDIDIPTVFENIKVNNELDISNAKFNINGTVFDGVVPVAALPSSTTATQGIIRTAKVTEAQAGTNNDAAVTPAGLQAKVNTINSTIAEKGVPAGTIMYYVGETAPANWLVCNGASNLNTYTYRELHKVISDTFGGTAYAAGTTDQPGVTTTFTLPDLQGTFVRGWTDKDTGAYNVTTNPDPSRDFGSRQNDALEEHGHTIVDPGHDHTAGGQGGNNSPGGQSGGAPSGPTSEETTDITIPAGGELSAKTNANETRPVNIALLPIIKI